MDPKKPIPIVPNDTDTAVSPAPEPQEKSGGMVSEGGESGGGAGSSAEDTREGGMIGEG
jgi:hypothetical protein